jgi:hypothetical protein
VVKYLTLAIATAYVVLGLGLVVLQPIDALSARRQLFLGAVLIIYGCVRFYRIFRQKNTKYYD